MMESPSAYQVALKYLSGREYSAHGLSVKLRAKNFAESEIQETLEILQQKKYLDDTRFAENYCRGRYQAGCGPLRMQQELLQQHKILKEIAGVAIEKLEWLGRAEEIRRKKFDKSFPQDKKQIAKQMRFLQYRGFLMEEIYTLFNNAECEKTCEN